MGINCIKDVVESNKAYHVGKTLVKLQFKAAHAKSEKIFSLEIISNSPVTDGEWSRYETTMKQQNVSFPKKVDVVEKLKEIKQAKDHVFTEVFYFFTKLFYFFYRKKSMQ